MDDFLIAGNEKNRRWREVLEVFYKAFRWSPWEQDRFKQTGLELIQDPKTGEITFSQAEYLKQIQEIDVPKDRSKNPDAPCTEKEISKLRGLLGALQWLCTQSRPDVCAEVGLLQTEVSKATVATLSAANKVLRKAQKTALDVFKVVRLEGGTVVIGWSDSRC